MRCFFDDASQDTPGICCAGPDRPGVACTRPEQRTVPVARTAAVAVLDEHVDPGS